MKTLSSKVIYENKWMTLREDAIERDSGAEGIYSVVEKPPFVVILAVQNQQVYLVQQYRYPIKARCWELPQGAWEARPDASPEILAAGELREETGLSANTWQYLGEQYLAYGFCNQVYHVFFATGLTQGKNALDPEEEDLICKAFSLTEFEDMIRSGEIKDATTVNAFGLARLHELL